MINFDYYTNENKAKHRINYRIMFLHYKKASKKRNYRKFVKIQKNIKNIKKKFFLFFALYKNEIQNCK